MSSFVGLNPSAADAKADALGAHLGSLQHLISELTQTQQAAQNPHAHGIAAGDKTVSAVSLSAVIAARTDLASASASITDLVARIRAEVGSQNATSGNRHNFSTAVGAPAPKHPKNGGADPFGDILGVVQTFRKYRTLLVSGPRSMLQAPAALGFLSDWPQFWATGANAKFWFSKKNYDYGSAFLKAYATDASTNRFVSALYNKANLLKADYWWNKGGTAALSLMGDAKMVPQLAESLAKSTAFVKSASMWAGKGLGVVGIGFSAFTLVEGIVGASDGDVTSEDAWAIADGTVGLICGIGSLAPPPVGVVFAAVGGAYALGRWLFGADDSGKTGIDHIADGVNAAAKWTGEAATNVANFTVGAEKAIGQGIINGASVVVNTVDTAVKDAQKVIGNLWPWH